MKTLVLLFHSNLAQSKTNRVLADAARTVPGVEVVDMQALYPQGRLDMARDGDPVSASCKCRTPSSQPMARRWLSAENARERTG